jgi:polyisoprenoid-binding protein YceI
MKFILSLLAALVITATSSAQTTWTIDVPHSKISFSVAHMVISETEGRFTKFDAKVTSNNADFTDATVEFSADVNSIDTDNAQRDGHLKSPDFFDAAKYPTLTFKSTSFKKVDGNKYKVTGDLTIKGVTKSVELDATYGGTQNLGAAFGNGVKAGFKLTGAINRKDFGLTWNKALETGGVVVGETVSLSIKVELNQAKS